jgi:hypothetical protein
MTIEISKDDQDWLDALSGKSPAGIDPLNSAQALAVRKALVARRNAIETDAINVGGSGLDEIRARLQREGLMEPAEPGQLKTGWWHRVKEVLGVGSVGRGMNVAPIWGVAATLVLAALVTFQIYDPQPDEASIYRGEPNTTTLIFENPELRANEIVAGIEKLSSDGVEIARLKDGGIQLKIKDTQRVQDYLLAQRIEAVPVEGMIRIDVVPKRK